MVVESFTLLRQQYMNEVHKQHAKEQQQMIFMNQWIHQMKTPVSVIELLRKSLAKSIVRQGQQLKVFVKKITVY